MEKMNDGDSSRDDANDEVQMLGARRRRYTYLRPTLQLVAACWLVNVPPLGSRNMMLGEFPRYNRTYRGQTVPKIASYYRVEEVNTRVTELAELHEAMLHILVFFTKDMLKIVWLPRIHSESIWTRIVSIYTLGERNDPLEQSDFIMTSGPIEIIFVFTLDPKSKAHQTQLQLQSYSYNQTTEQHVHRTRFQMQQAEIAALQETDIYAGPMQQGEPDKPGPRCRESRSPGMLLLGDADMVTSE
ncbi:hypothetical protein Tco_0811246 [Tanacetum coccineum]